MHGRTHVHGDAVGGADAALDDDPRARVDLGGGGGDVREQGTWSGLLMAGCWLLIC